MKKVILFLCFALLGQCFFAQETTPKKKKKKKDKTETSTGSGRQMGPQLTIDFISHGGGIDNAAYDKVVAFANNYGKPAPFTEGKQGREGERKMSFTLAGLDAAERDSFVAGIRNLVGSNDRVLINSKYGKSNIKNGPKADLGAPQGVKMRLVISFISKGAGIDGKAMDKVKNFIDNHPKKPSYEVAGWGREGEKDYVLTLKELTQDEQKLFIDDLKKLVSNTDMVLFRENENYVKKGR